MRQMLFQTSASGDTSESKELKKGSWLSAIKGDRKTPGHRKFCLEPWERNIENPQNGNLKNGVMILGAKLHVWTVRLIYSRRGVDILSRLINDRLDRGRTKFKGVNKESCVL